MFFLRSEAGVDICPERMDAADAEAPRPPQIERAVEFWSGLGVETVEEATMLSLETAVDICPERVDAEAQMPPRIETTVEFCSGVEATARMQAVDNCPERMNAAALRPPRIETAVESWSGMGVETAVEETMLSLETAVDTCVE